MKTNAAGLEIIKHFEGFSPSVYLDPVGIPTIGYGSTWDINGNRVTASHPDVTEDDAEALLRRELSHVEWAIERLVHSALTENMFSALASWAYHVGTGAMQRSTLRMKLNRRDYEGAADEFPKWRRAGGAVLRGLVRRRAAERRLFLA